MILPEKLALIAAILEGRIGIDASELQELAKAAPEASRFVGSSVGKNGQAKPYRAEKGVAMIPVLGSLVNRGAWIGANSGMTSYEGLAFQLDQAAADPEVRSIVLDMDSPGGEAVGAFEIADKVRNVAKSKPVVAVINGMAASAAYGIAAAATKIMISPSGVAGSIGVVLMHADYSVALDKKGIKPTLIHAGAHKVDGNPYEPLSTGVRADLQAEVDQFYSMFVSSVARGRGGRMTEKSIRATEARTFIGQKAIDAGVADQIGDIAGALAELSSGNVLLPSNDSGLTGVKKADMIAPPPVVTADPKTVAAIMALPEAIGREESARRIANSGASVDTARAVLATLTTTAQRAAAERAAASAPQRERAAKITQSWNDVVADINRRMRGR
ncbi:MAG: S49 family peptidase [Chthoniobacter sp.]|nr:S49 family peptidase [Chthoniobacter sp.]